jgi:hypothetical protein
MRHVFFLLCLIPFLPSCTDVVASAPPTVKTIQCETVIGPVEWQSDTVCGVDKLGRQMVSIGGFSAVQLPAHESEGEEKTVAEAILEHQNRTGCVSISRHCTITE